MAMAVAGLPLAPPTSEELWARLVAAETALAAEKERADKLAADHERLLAAYRQLQLELKLLRQGIYVASAERVDTAQLELEFAEKQAALAALAQQLGAAVPAGETTAPSGETSAPAPSGEAPAPSPDATPPAPPTSPDKPKAKPKGRRDVRTLPIAEERQEILDDELEGKAERIGFEESHLLGWRKAGPVRIVIARAKYRDKTDEGTTTIVTAALPPRTFARCLAAPSLLARIITDKYSDGLPLYRQEERFAREGLKLDRGTMCRWIEDAGMTAGCVVLAAKADAFATAFCISTDATGIGIQPEPSPTKARQPCRRGHFFVMVADRDHVLFEYVPRETSAAVRELFRGYSGYVQADAKNTYDVLFDKPDPALTGEDTEVCHEVGCWSHARRRFYQAAIGKDRIAREGLWRIHKLFELDETWKAEPPAKRKALRDKHLRPLLDAFFVWAEAEYAKVVNTRGLLRSALGYIVRQQAALRRFLEDGRLRMDNNISELELRRIAVGRKAWLFVGSDDHAQATANLFSLIASCKLHGLDPEAYLRDLFRVLVHWPRDRYLELTPRFWAKTRARLDPRELELPIGRLTVPEATTEQAAAS
jgi:transposase